MKLMDRLRLAYRAATLANPDPWLFRAFGWNQTAAGIEVTPETALTYSAVWGCVNGISMDLAKLPLQVYQKLPKGREKAPGHPLYPLLHDAPNPEITSVAFRSALQVHMLTWGNAYANIVYDGNGIAQLWPLRPDRMEGPYRDEQAQLIYVYTLPSGERRKLTRDHIWHIPGLGYDGIKGYSVIALAKEGISLGLAYEKFGAKFFSNGARPGGVLKHPQSLSPKAFKRLQDQFENMHQGLENSHRLAILEEGLSYEKVGIPPEEAQFLEGRDHQIADIARWYRYPLHKLQKHDKAATYASVEQFGIEYVTDTLMPWAVIWEQNIALQLMTPTDRRRFEAKLNLTALLRGESKNRAEFYNRLFMIGVLSINDIRELEEMNGIGPAGDGHYVPLNMLPVEQSQSLTPKDRARLLASLRNGGEMHYEDPVLDHPGSQG